MTDFTGFSLSPWATNHQHVHSMAVRCFAHRAEVLDDQTQHRAPAGHQGGLSICSLNWDRLLSPAEGKGPRGRGRWLESEAVLQVYQLPRNVILTACNPVLIFKKSNLKKGPTKGKRGEAKRLK